MSLIETLKIALRSLRANKMRSALTMLGIIIGVASVVTMVAVGQGAQTQIQEQIRSLGANVLMILPGAANQGGVRQEAGSGQSLTEGDAEAIGQLPSVRASAPSIRGTFQIVAGNQNVRTNINGTTADYFVIREWGLQSGRYFSGDETTSGAKVAIIGRTVADELFGEDANAVGRSVRILNSPFEIIGVLAEKGPAGTGRDQDDIAFLPITTARQRLIGGANQVSRDAVGYVLVKAQSDQAMPAAQQQVTGLLRQRHRIRPDGENDFRVTDPAAAMEAQTAATRILGWLLAAIASVSLIVGGISIMNIMLVSVTERTREIGLRMAVGARRYHIRRQFLLESVTLCLLGGLVGVVVGIGTSTLVAWFAGWPVFLAPQVMLLALGFAALVGVGFGFYPAYRAAKLAPINCLRAD